MPTSRPWLHGNVEVVHDASETRDANNLLQNLSRLLLGRHDGNDGKMRL